MNAEAAAADAAAVDLIEIDFDSIVVDLMADVDSMAVVDWLDSVSVVLFVIELALVSVESTLSMVAFELEMREEPQC